MGAISIVNAIACGRGASLALDLPTTAKVSVREERGAWRVFRNGEGIRSSLAIQTARRAILMVGRNPDRFSGTIETSTSVPMGVGLKTSSSASVAIALAVASALGKSSCSASSVLMCSAKASLAAGVSVTGAFDDAAACLLGGVNFADNKKMRLLASMKIGRKMEVLVRIPRSRSRRSSVRTRTVRQFAGLASYIFKTGRERSSIGKAMTLNGLLYSSIYGYEALDALRAIDAGAVGAGLSGTGPAVGAIFERRSDARKAARIWADDGATVISTETCDGGAKVGL